MSDFVDHLDAESLRQPVREFLGESPEKVRQGDFAKEPFKTLLQGINTGFAGGPSVIMAWDERVTFLHTCKVFHNVTPVDPKCLFPALLDVLWTGAQVKAASFRTGVWVLETGFRRNAVRAWPSGMSVEQTVKVIHQQLDYSTDRHIFNDGEYVQSVTGSDAKYLHYFVNRIYRHSTTVEEGCVVKYDATTMKVQPDGNLQFHPELSGHSSNPEFKKMGSDPTMEALRDRTVQVTVPLLSEVEPALILQLAKSRSIRGVPDETVTAFLADPGVWVFTFTCDG